METHSGAPAEIFTSHNNGATLRCNRRISAVPVFIQRRPSLQETAADITVLFQSSD